MELFLIALFPLFFAGLWAGIILLVSYVGGWNGLARDFPDNSDDKGAPLSGHSFSSVQLSWLGSYNNCMRIRIHENGLRMQPIAIFRMFHAPVFIRWDEMQEAVSGQVVFYKTWKFRAGSHSVRIFGRAAKEVAEFYARSHS